MVIKSVQTTTNMTMNRRLTAYELWQRADERVEPAGELPTTLETWRAYVIGALEQGNENFLDFDEFTSAATAYQDQLMELTTSKKSSTAQTWRETVAANGASAIDTLAPHYEAPEIALLPEDQRKPLTPQEQPSPATTEAAFAALPVAPGESAGGVWATAPISPQAPTEADEIALAQAQQSQGAN